ncbi:hypothetical protein ABZS66_55480 [Dactylosporangium sp. NPDC005572]|uniref:hypothetical protein n=1 Tax=Dactylosporangium sp. NPDC005572 TaxID=3156889 RepID=UPI0033B3883E
MFGRNDERIDALERRLAAAEARLAQAAALLDDTARVERMAAQAERMAEAVRRTVAAAADLAGTAVQPRWSPEVGKVYRSDGYGFLAVCFTGGRTDDLTILAGPDDPPSERAAEADTKHDLNSFAAAVLRPGEYWMIDARPGHGYLITYTPLF